MHRLSDRTLYLIANAFFAVGVLSIAAGVLPPLDRESVGFGCGLTISSNAVWSRVQRERHAELRGRTRFILEMTAIALACSLATYYAFRSSDWKEAVFIGLPMPALYIWRGSRTTVLD